MKNFKITAVIIITACLAMSIAGCSTTKAPEKDINTAAPTTSDTINTEVTAATNTDEIKEPKTPLSGNPKAVTTTSTEKQPAVSTDNANDKASPSTQIDIIATAKELIGTPFKEYGKDEKGFDNSGFIYYCLNQNKVDCPRLIKDQVKLGKEIKFDELTPGDLVFFSTDNSGKADFGGIYIGNGEMIYSSTPGTNVKTTNITSKFWTDSFFTAITF